MDNTTPKRNVRAMSLSADWENVLTQAEHVRPSSLCRAIKGDHVFSQHPGYILHEKPTVTFCTGSTYAGQWNALGMGGFGTFIFPHNVEYEGNLFDGMFHGEGTLQFPMGQKIDGIWVKGRLVKFKFRFADGLEYDIPWDYCKMPDRRYYTCIQEGFRPAGRSLTTNIHPPRTIPEGCYDTGDGFYNPATKCVNSAIDPEKILRIPTNDEEKWIMENCRKAWDEPTGYRPDLYENWISGRRTDLGLFSRRSENDMKFGEDGSNNLIQSESLGFIMPPVFKLASGLNISSNF